MSLLSAVIVLCALLTSILSGIVGMAGGLVLMGVFVWLLPAAPALALHGVIQFAANGWRVLLHRTYVNWRVLLNFGLGAVLAMGLFALIVFTPTRLYVFVMLGLLPVLVWVPERWLRLDALNPWHAIGGGFVSTGISLVSGVSGPLTDLLFVRTDMGRHSVVATKSAMQALTHGAKIIAYGAVLMSAEARAVIAPATIVAAIVASMIGTVIGGRILDRMSDAHFRLARRWIVTLVGVVFLVQAGQIAWG
ncbi:TSUP family transporter [Altererythrobacter xixiisoli]|uniref:Probable membrane transporter protein n=1 Tax=Croceibacterium xixiisoli TaxID=1476466 RepID=A0A6I4TSN0_9SPHN|nr:sulfite exporter TauE/SafE family protein [Croceibacterium xixiisoli]MXO99155.1 TSUP family transporter [Croceibacterium xixiisoli]